MLGYIIIAVFVLVVIVFVYFAYKNEKKYEEERRQRRQDNRKEEKTSTRKPTIEKPAEVSKQFLKQTNLEEKKPLFTPRQKESVYQKSKKETTVDAPVRRKTVEVTEKSKSIPVSLANYPKFDHARLIEMGLSQEEAKEFVQELIPQIEIQIPLLKKAMDASDFQSMERLTHSIKGSSTTVGTGGVSDLLIDYNTYLKTGTEPAIAEAYLEHLKHYYKELKEQYA